MNLKSMSPCGSNAECVADKIRQKLMRIYAFIEKPMEHNNNPRAIVRLTNDVSFLP